jgi:hypothetical protein
LDDYLEIVIHHAQRHPTKESEGAVVCIKDHFLGFARIGGHKHLAGAGIRRSDWAPACVRRKSRLGCRSDGDSSGEYSTGREKGRFFTPGLLF